MELLYKIVGTRKHEQKNARESSARNVNQTTIVFLITRALRESVPVRKTSGAATKRRQYFTYQRDINLHALTNLNNAFFEFTDKIDNAHLDVRSLANSLIE